MAVGAAILMATPLGAAISVPDVEPDCAGPPLLNALPSVVCASVVMSATIDCEADSGTVVCNGVANGLFEGKSPAHLPGWMEGAFSVTWTACLNGCLDAEYSTTGASIVGAWSVLTPNSTGSESKVFQFGPHSAGCMMLTVTAGGTLTAHAGLDPFSVRQVSASQSAWALRQVCLP